MPPQSREVRKAITLSFVMVGLASTAVAATKFASTHTSTEVIVSVQYLVCTLLCLPRIVRAGTKNLKTQRLRLHFFRGIVGVIGFYLFYASIKHIPMVDAMLLRQSAPLMVPLVLLLWQGEKVARSTWWPLAIGFIGIAVILRPTPAGLSWWHACGLISAITLSLSMVATRRLASTEPTYRILFYYVVLSLICVAPLSIGRFQNIPIAAWLAMLYIGIAIYGTLDLYTRAYGMAPTEVIAPINYFAVVLAGMWGWLFWQQVPDFWSISGSCLVIFGGLLTIRSSRTQVPKG